MITFFQKQYVKPLASGLFVGVVIFFAFLVYQYKQNHETIRFLKNETTAYRNEKYGYEVQYPAWWKVNDGLTDYASGANGLRVTFGEGVGLPGIEVEIFQKMEDDDSAVQAYARMFPNVMHEIEANLFVAGTNATYYRSPQFQPSGNVVFDDGMRVYNIRQFTDDETFYNFLSSFKLINSQTSRAIQNGDFVYCSLNDLRELSRSVDVVASTHAILKDDANFKKLIDCLLIYKNRYVLTRVERNKDINNDGTQEFVVFVKETETQKNLYMILMKSLYGNYYSPTPPFLASSQRYYAPVWLREGNDQLIDINGDKVFEIIRDGTEIFTFKTNRFVSTAPKIDQMTPGVNTSLTLWVKAGFPIEYYRSVDLWYPSEWSFRCCETEESVYNHFVFSSNGNVNAPYIRVLDFVILECFSDEIMCATTPDYYFEKLRSSLDGKGELLFGKDRGGFQKIGIIPLDQFVGSTFFYRRTSPKDNVPELLYIFNTGGGVVGVLFHDYEKIGYEIISEFLKRLTPKNTISGGGEF